MHRQPTSACAPPGPGLDPGDGPTAAGPPASAVPPASTDLAGVRVLLAEDNKTNQKVAVQMLKRLGCTFEVVEDGFAALRKLDEAEFDAVLMDVQMPGMDGYQATEEIRRRERARPGSRHLPVIAMTANALQGDRERCLAAQMDDYLSKPVALADLAEAIGRWVARPAPPAPAVLRVARLREVSQGDAAFERELLDCLLADVAHGMDLFRAALEAPDPAQVAATLHGIVGACRTVGADDLAACSRDGELQARRPGFRPDPAWVALIERKRADLVAAIAAHLAG